MDIVKQLGELAFGSRIRRISNALMSDGLKIYEQHQFPFEPKWFPTFYYLNENYPEPVGITDIANATRVSHPLVNRFVNELIRIGHVREMSDRHDKRRRMIALSPGGRELAEKLRPIWNDFELSLREIICAADPNLMQILERLENRIDQEGLFDTYMRRVREQQYQRVKITINDPADFQHFRDINVEWLEAYFKVEPHDTEILDHPQQIIEKGGFIFSASLDGEVLGCCALLRLDKDIFELSKMGVYERGRGKQIGKRLMNASIATAKEAGGKVIYLESNNSLKAALNLYLDFGFEFTPESHTGESLYQRANVFMKLEL